MDVVELIRALEETHHVAARYGVLAPYADINNELSKMTRAYNHGRARGVSLKRPSPQLSRMRADIKKTQARLNLITRRNSEVNRELGMMFMPVLKDSE